MRVWELGLGPWFGFGLCVCGRALTPCLSRAGRMAAGGGAGSSRATRPSRRRWEPVGTAGSRREREGGAAGRPRELLRSPGGSPQSGIGMGLLGIWPSERWVMLGSVVWRWPPEQGGCASSMALWCVTSCCDSTAGVNYTQNLNPGFSQPVFFAGLGFRTSWNVFWAEQMLLLFRLFWS